MIIEANHTREGEGGAGAVSSGAGSACVLLAFMLACFSRCARVLEGKSTWDAFWGMEIWHKRKVCGVTSVRKVPTCRFLVKKEVVWRDLLSAKNIRKCH